MDIWIYISKHSSKPGPKSHQFKTPILFEDLGKPIKVLFGGLVGSSEAFMAIRTIEPYYEFSLSVEFTDPRSRYFFKKGVNRDVPLEDIYKSAGFGKQYEMLIQSRAFHSITLRH